MNARRKSYRIDAESSLPRLSFTAIAVPLRGANDPFSVMVEIRLLAGPSDASITFVVSPSLPGKGSRDGQL